VDIDRGEEAVVLHVVGREKMLILFVVSTSLVPRVLCVGGEFDKKVLLQAQASMREDVFGLL
jgi:hypothetical protein